MPDEPVQDKFLEIVTDESDTFRLAIRGFAEIEREMDAAILEAFTGDLPKNNVRRLGGFATRLTLAVALGIVPKPFRPSLEAVADVRNDLAHGAASDVTPQRLKAIRDVLRASLVPIAGDKPLAGGTRHVIETASPHMILFMGLIHARAVVKVGAEEARRRRAQPQDTSAVRRAILSSLTGVSQGLPGE